jgi:hypothetical protein
MRRLLILGLLLAAALVIQPAAGWAGWVAGATGSGETAASSVSQLAAPTVTRSGSTAVVSWGQGTLANGVVAKGYVVKRTVGATTTTICTTIEPARTCTDSAPNAGTASYVVQATYRNWVGPASNPTSFTMDSVAPTTTLSSNPAPNATGWVTSTPTLTLTATDGSSGVASITYKIGAAAPTTVNGSSASFSVGATGSTTVTYYATDNAGNVETTKSYLVKLDDVAPTTSVSSNPAPNANGWVTSTPTLTLTANDATSGVTSITYKIGTGPGQPVTVNGSSTSFAVPNAGTTTVTYYATDVAGNVETTKTYTVKRDNTVPGPVTISDPDQNGSYVVGNNGTGSWAKTCGGRGGICATANDPEAPIVSVTYRLIKNGNTCWNGSAFVSGTTCSVALTFSSANNDWNGGPTRQQMGVSNNWSLTVTATNQAGLTKTSTAVSFKTT